MPDKPQKTPFPELCWTPGKFACEVDKLFGYSAETAQESIDWYKIKVRRKRQGAWFLRIGAIVLGVFAGVIPVLCEIFSPQVVQAAGEAAGGAASRLFNPLWASVVVALAGLLIMLDQYLGLTSGWIRFIITSQKLAQMLDDFRLGCEDSKAGWGDQGPDLKKTRAAIKDCRDFMTRAHNVVREETNAWATEFKAAVKQIGAELDKLKSK